jgi:hypothetical protein
MVRIHLSFVSRQPGFLREGVPTASIIQFYSYIRVSIASVSVDYEAQEKA